MRVERTWLARDSAGAPLTFTKCLWRSDPTLWSGFPLETHRIGPLGRLREFDVPDILLGVCIAGSALMEFGRGAQARNALLGPGDFVLLDRGADQQPIGWWGMRETLYVRLQAAQLRLLAPQLGDGDIRVTPRHADTDAQVERLALCMADEARAGGPNGAVYAESLSLALATYLLHRDAPDRAAPARPAASLTHAKASALRDYVTAHLGADLTLVELAQVAGLSPHYFVQVFRNTFGSTPHRYILAERVDRARRLLRDDALSISDIALALGFADQSHFTATFHRATGTTPKRFRQSH